MAKKMSLAAKFGNTKSRTVVLFFGVIFLIAIAVALSKLTASDDPLSERASQTTAIPENIRAIPGNKTPEKYRELQIQDNLQRAEEAKTKGGNRSAIPTIVHTDVVKGTRGGFGLIGDEIIHGESPYGPYGLEADGTTAFGVGPDGQVYSTEGYIIHGYGPNGPYGIGPDGKPFGIAPDGKPYGIGPDGKPLFGLGPDGQLVLLGPDGKPLLDENGNPIPLDFNNLPDGIDPSYFDYAPGGPKATEVLSRNMDGYQIHGYGPNGPYGVGPDGKPFGVGPDGRPYDPEGPYAPAWYEPPKKSAAQIAQARIDEERARIEKMREERLARIQKQQDSQKQQKRQQVDAKTTEERVALMDGQAKALFQAWSTVTPQMHIYGNQFYANIEAERAAKAERVDAITPGQGRPAAGGLGTYNPSDEVITAGSILFAVVDTAVNSDENGPVLATIVHGDYKGARIIGSFVPPNANSESLTVQFNKIVFPDLNKSIGIEAVAVDPDTARTAIATDVDHHYLARYGALFASAFMEGYGKAIKEAGASRTENQDGTTTTATSNLSGEQEVFAALGNVGTQWSQQAAPLFNQLPTITIDSGTGIGVLFMSDLNISQESNG